MATKEYNIKSYYYGYKGIYTKKSNIFMLIGTIVGGKHSTMKKILEELCFTQDEVFFIISSLIIRRDVIGLELALDILRPLDLYRIITMSRNYQYEYMINFLHNYIINNRSSYEKTLDTARENKDIEFLYYLNFIYEYVNSESYD